MLLVSRFPASPPHLILPTAPSKRSINLPYKSLSSAPKRCLPKKKSNGSGVLKLVILRIPTSTADTVTIAFLPPAFSTFTFATMRFSGSIWAGTFTLTFNLRASRASGNQVKPTARAGVTLSPWLPGRNTTVETYMSERFQFLSIGMLTVVPSVLTVTRLLHNTLSASTKTKASPSCGGTILSLTSFPGLAGAPSSCKRTRSGRLPTLSLSCAFHPA